MIYMNLYALLGALGLFLYGMKIFADSMQAMFSDVIRNLMTNSKRGRIPSVLAGFFTTFFTQSSSVSTVMIVGLANAGLIKLSQSIGMIIGANIGSTLSSWLLATNYREYGVLLIGIGVFPALFFKSQKWKLAGKIVLGLGIIFFGLQSMIEHIYLFRGSEYLSWLVEHSIYLSKFSILAFVVIGLIITVLMQFSSFILGIVIVLCMDGIISLEAAWAIVLGLNVGTTLSSFIAAAKGNVHSKRVACSHGIFNIVGMIVALIFFSEFIELVKSIFPINMQSKNEYGIYTHMPLYIAMGHTLFNIGIAVVFFPLIKPLGKLVKKIIPDKEIKEQHHLVMLGSSSDIVPATSLIQSVYEINKFSDIVGRMYRRCRTYLYADEADARMLAKIKDYERISDNIQDETVQFITKIMEKELSVKQSEDAQSMLRIVDELESLADHLDKLAIYRTKVIDIELFKGESGEEFFELFDKIYDFYMKIVKGLVENRTYDMSIVDKESELLKSEYKTVRERHMIRVASGQYNHLTAITYSDMLMSLKDIRGHAHNIFQAMEIMSNYEINKR